MVFIRGANVSRKATCAVSVQYKKTISCKGFQSEHTRWLHGQQLTGPRKRVRPPDFVAVLVGWLEDRHRTRMRGPHTYTYAYFSRAKFSCILDREKCKKLSPREKYLLYVMTLTQYHQHFPTLVDKQKVMLTVKVDIGGG